MINMINVINARFNTRSLFFLFLLKIEQTRQTKTRPDKPDKPDKPDQTKPWLLNSLPTKQLQLRIKSRDTTNAATAPSTSKPGPASVPTKPPACR